MELKSERRKHIYKNWKTEDLLKAVTIDKAEYEPLAIDIMNQELQTRGVNPEEDIRSLGEATPNQKPKLPLIWPGYAIAAIFFVLELFVEIDFKYSPGGMLAGIYWLFCVYQMHQVLINEDNSYPITPAKATWYHFIPLFNLYWIFKWPYQLGKFVNERKSSSERSTTLEISGIFLLISLAIGRFAGGAIGMAVVFTIGMYFNRKISSVIGLKKIEPIVEEKTYWV